MGRRSSMTVAALLVICCAFGSWQVHASDPELTTDFAVPKGKKLSDIDGYFFTSTALRNVSTNSEDFATVTGVNLASNPPFPALEGLGVSAALLQYPPGAVNPPHTHPRGTELLYIIEGTLDVGLVDTTPKLFTQTLCAGDLFVFPKGLVHFQINNDKRQTVRAFAGFSSSNPGLVRLPNTLFTESNISDDVLAKSFGVSTSVIDKLQAATVE